VNRVRLALLAATTMLVATLTSAPAAVQATSADTNPFGVQSRSASPALQQKIGSAWTVITMTWPEVEPVRGRFDFAKFDQLVEAQAAVGVQSQFRLLTCANDARGKPFWGTYPVPAGAELREGHLCTEEVPRSQQAWSEFVFALVHHYRRAAHPVRHFAVANEIVSPKQWPGVAGRQSCSMVSCPVFDDYLTTLRTAHKAAHAANPDVVILDGGIGPVMGAVLARAKYEAGGKSDTALRAAVAFLNQWYVNEYPAGAPLEGKYVNPNQPVGPLRSQFTSLVYGPYNPPSQTSTTGDRPYYIATRSYLDPTAIDAIQMHFYDYPPYIVDLLAFMGAHTTPDKPVYCWECGMKWPVKNGQYYRFDPELVGKWVAQRARLGFAHGLDQHVWLPMTGSLPPADETSGDLPLVCVQPQSPGVCSTDSNLSVAGVAYQRLIANR